LKLKHWFAFILLATMWSSSFLWIKIAVQELSPILLVALRTLFGALVGILAILFTRTKLPRQRQVWVALAVLGLTNVAVPFALISWGEQVIDSAVASILNATVPLFTFLIASMFLQGDRLTPSRILGLVTGFVGVIILLVKDLQPGSHNSIIGQGAVLLAAIFYAGSMVYASLTTDRVPGLVRGILPLVSASTLMWTAAALLENPIRIPAHNLAGSHLVGSAWFRAGIHPVVLSFAGSWPDARLIGDLYHATGRGAAGCHFSEGTTQLEPGTGWFVDRGERGHGQSKAG
jgi:drug/metabolite transporter (DMT)-like permease